MLHVNKKGVTLFFIKPFWKTKHVSEIRSINHSYACTIIRIRQTYVDFHTSTYPKAILSIKNNIWSP